MRFLVTGASGLIGRKITEIILNRGDKLNVLTTNKKKIHKSLQGINLSDILIIKNWIYYAYLIGDFSYKDIYYEEAKSSFIEAILEPQLTFRKKNLIK